MKTKLKILHLEDTPFDVEMVTRELNKADILFDKLVVDNKKDFQKALKDFSPDIVLSDHSLASFDSIRALHLVNEIAPGIPFILVTSTVSEEFAADIIKLGASDYILKDRLKRLPAAIESAMKQKKAEQQKEFDSNNLRSLINNTDDLMWSVDRELRLITFNDSFQRVIELTSGKKLGKGDKVLSSQFTDTQLKRYELFYERALSGETFTVIDHFEMPNEFWSEISFYPIRQGNELIGTACFSRDITERKKADENLKLLEKKMLEQKIQEHKKIARAIIKAQETQRNHIGQELHDNINQILAGTKLYLSIAGNKNEEVKALVKYPMELIDNSIEEIRSLCSKLVTPLKNIDLEVLIHDLFEKLDNTGMIKTALIFDMPKKLLSDDLKLNIYRIIQELINNILKYAEAKNVNISMTLKDERINIIVTDDGNGFDVEKKRNGIGISNMINRVETFNGEIEIESSLGNGSSIKISIPY